MMLVISFLVGGVLGVAAMMLLRVGRLADLEQAVIDLLMKYETRVLRAEKASATGGICGPHCPRALRVGEEFLLMQEFLLDLEALYGEFSHEKSA